MAKKAKPNGARSPTVRKRSLSTPHLETLTFRQRMFVMAYLGEANGNASEAARIAGYAAPAIQGHENLRKPNIRIAIDAKLDEVALSANEILARLSDMASADMGEFTDKTKGGGFALNLTKARSAGKLHLVKKLAHTKEGVRIELHDSQAALEKLARYRGLIKERIEHTGKDGGAIEVTIEERIKAEREVQEWRREVASRVLPSSISSVPPMPKAPES